MNGWMDRQMDRQTDTIKHYSRKKYASSDTNPHNQNGFHWDYALFILISTMSDTQYGAQ